MTGRLSGLAVTSASVPVDPIVHRGSVEQHNDLDEEDIFGARQHRVTSHSIADALPRSERLTFSEQVKEIELEIAKFKALPKILSSDDAREWWACMAKEFPFLMKLALRLFVISPTEIENERDFSHASLY